MGYFKSLATPERVPRSLGNEIPEAAIGGATYFNFDGHNQVILDWIPKVVTRLKSNVLVLMPDGKTKSPVIRGDHSERRLADSIVGRTKKEYGSINRATFNFERHGVFVHKGVGQGYRMKGLKVTRYAKSEANPARQPVEWFNPVLDQLIPELADKLAQVNADIVLNASRMMIK